MSKKLKFIVIIVVSIAISAAAAYSLTEMPPLQIFPANYDYKMPTDLVEKLNEVDKLSFVKLAQHGYTHAYNETPEIIERGYNVLRNNSINIAYYIPTFQQEVLPFATPAEQFYIPERMDGIYYAKEGMDYGNSSIGGIALSIHIQDKIYIDWLDKILEGKEIDYIRVDDVNTDIVDTNTQISRIFTVISYCGKRNCTAVFGIIPRVPRMYDSDKAYIFFNKTMIFLGIMLLLPIYLFYFLSYYLSWWLRR